MHELQTNNDSLLFDREPTPTKSLAERVAEDAASPELQADRDPDLDKAIGITMFDVPGSEDQTLTVLLPQQNIQYAASQSLLRIKSKGDDRVYLGIVVAGPFAEPDSLRGDSNMLVTVATRKVDYRPPYHGRVQVSLLGEQLKDGTLCPHRWRPLPNSPVFALSDAEAQSVFKAAGDLRLGLVVGYDKVVVGIPSREKSVLPRHTAILGTTGGGKSTTVAGLVQQAQAADMSVILLDVEGEYTRLHEKTTNPGMLTALEARKLAAEGLPPDKMSVHCLVGCAPANPDHPNPKVFSLQFARLSPYAAAEILGLSEPQQVRFMKANDIAKEVLRDLNIFPRKGNKDDERMAMEIDEFEGGYPNLTLSIFIDVVTACLKVVEAPKSTRKGSEDEVHVEFTPYNKRLGARRMASPL